MDSGWKGLRLEAGRSFGSLGVQAGGEDGGPDCLGARNDSRGRGRWPELSGGWGWGTEVACLALGSWAEDSGLD